MSQIVEATDISDVWALRQRRLYHLGGQLKKHTRIYCRGNNYQMTLGGETGRTHTG